MNIVVLYGSKSCEHEISVITAKQVIAAASVRHNVYAVYIDRQGVWRYVKDWDTDYSDCKIIGKCPTALIAPYGNNLYTVSKRGRQKKIAAIDAVIPALHGLNGEDGTVQGLLTLAGLPCASGSVAACAVTMDKILTKETLRGLDIPVLDYRILPNAKAGAEDISGMDFPLMVKPARLGSSIGVSRAENLTELKEKARTAFMYDHKVFCEKALTDFTEVNIAVYRHKDNVYISLAEKPLRKNDLLTFEDKYKTFSKKESKRVFPYAHPLIEKMRRAAAEAYTGLDLSGIVRIDFLIDNGADVFYVNEINAIPGSLAYYLFPETSFDRLIDRLVGHAIYMRQKENSLTYAHKTDIFNLRGKS